VTLLSVLAVKRRVIGALVLRELQARYGRDNLGFLWLMVEPLLFASGVLILWRLTRGPYERGVSVIVVTLCGYLPLLLFRHTVSRALGCIRNNVNMLYHRRVTILDLFWAMVVSEFAGNLLAMSFAFSVLYVLGLIDWPADPPLLFLGYFYMAWFTLGIALIVAALAERSELVEKIWTPMSYLMVPLSGAYFLVGWLPPGPYREYYLMIPTVSAYELVRSGFFGPGVPGYWNQPYIAGVSAVCTLYGLVLFRQARHHLKLE
jgi:capsular polysaccharide transport system permease protein